MTDLTPPPPEAIAAQRAFDEAVAKAEATPGTDLAELEKARAARMKALKAQAKLYKTDIRV
ncbi:hypothetical protein ABGB18_42590 [Nonomuraea sp. B12E4]|uniref:hypothetical protein n=1 Tax=Nonomuraea sp. B12E4 TaxID=3153564 RepID=UPI00325F57CA